MKRDLFVLLLCICTLGFVACSHKGNGEKVTYRFAPKIGQSMEYTTTSVTETSFFGQPITFTDKVKTKQTPISKENGIFTLMSQIEDLSTTVSDPKANAAFQEKVQSTKAKSSARTSSPRSTNKATSWQSRTTKALAQKKQKY